MKFSDVIGQKQVVEKLLSSVREERVSHAQIFAGPEGSGKLALAIAFAQYISCEQPLPADSCGTCRSCVKYSRLVHPDLHFVFPVFKKGGSNDPVSDNFIDKWRELVNESPYFNLTTWLNSIGVENEQGLIYASEAGEIIKKLSLKTYESDFKCMVIWLPERMHTSTANKLLKLIEEPPEKTLFLLVSEEPGLILPTILSRCQFVRIPAIGRDDLAQAFSERLDIPVDRTRELAHIANGNFVKGKNLVSDDEVRAANLENFKSLMRLAYSRKLVELTDWAEKIAGTGREAQKRFLTFCVDQVRENYMLNIGQKKNRLVYLMGEEAEFAENFNAFINDGNVEKLNEEFNRAYTHIAANGNAKIVFLDMSLKIVKLIR